MWVAAIVGLTRLGGVRNSNDVDVERSGNLQAATCGTVLLHPIWRGAGYRRVGIGRRGKHLAEEMTDLAEHPLQDEMAQYEGEEHQEGTDAQENEGEETVNSGEQVVWLYCFAILRTKICCL